VLKLRERDGSVGVVPLDLRTLDALVVEGVEQFLTQLSTVFAVTSANVPGTVDLGDLQWGSDDDGDEFVSPCERATAGFVSAGIVSVLRRVVGDGSADRHLAAGV
jgi:hypothetical protein